MYCVKKMLAYRGAVINYYRTETRDHAHEVLELWTQDGYWVWIHDESTEEFDHQESFLGVR